MLKWSQNTVHQNHIVTEGKNKTYTQVESQRSYSLNRIGDSLTSSNCLRIRTSSILSEEFWDFGS